MSLTLQGATEDNVLTLLVWSEQHASMLFMSLTDDIFSTRSYQKIAKAALTYIERWQRPPQMHIMDLLEGDIRRGEEGRQLLEVIQQMQQLSTHLQPDYVIAELDKFVRIRRRMIALDASYEALQAGNETAAEDALHDFRSSTKQTAGMWLHDTDFSFLETREEDIFSSGVEVLDELGVRPETGTYTMLIAPKKRGKCIGADECVLLPDGRMKRIQDVVRDKDKQVLSMNPFGEVVVSDVSDHWDNGVRECAMVVTNTGRTLITTKTESYYTLDGWKPLDQIVPNETYIACTETLYELGTHLEIHAKARLLGFLLADGGLTKPYSTAFSKTDPEVQDVFTRDVWEIGDGVTWDTNRTVAQIVKRTNPARSVVRAWLHSIGIYEVKSKDKTIPNCVFTWTNATIIQFLRALFSCDGYISKDGVELSLANWYTVCQVKHLLGRLGITARVQERTARYRDKLFSGYGRLSIQGKRDIESFIHQIGFIGIKATRASEVLAHFNNKSSHARHNIIPWTYHLRFELVRAILPIGDYHTYDLTVPDNHNFIANDIVIHNSWSCVNVGKANWRRRRSVLHVTLENSAKLTKRRYWQAFFAMTKRDILSLNVPVLRRNAHDTEDFSIDEQSISPLSLTPANKEAILQHVRPLGSRTRLLIKHFPTHTLTIGQLNAYLDWLERTEDFKPELVIIDYPELMAVDTRNLRIDIGRINMQLRGLAEGRGFALYAPAQGNRTSDSVNIVRGNMIAEDWSKTGVADTIITYNQTPQEKARGLARLFVDGARDAEDGFVVLITQSYPIGQFCIDSVYMNATATSELARATGGGAPDTEDDDS